MIINPFVLGVLSTLFVEMAIGFAFIAVFAIKALRTKDNDNEI